MLSTNWKEVATKNYEVSKQLCVANSCGQWVLLGVFWFLLPACSHIWLTISHLPTQRNAAQEERQAPKGMEWRSWEGQKLKQQED